MMKKMVKKWRWIVKENQMDDGDMLNKRKISRRVVEKW